VSRFARYYRDPAATAGRIDADGWYHSGDLLERDAEGRFRFHSRLSDVLKVGGENVSAAEVIGHCREQMATFKVPRYVRFVSEWPMSGTKIQKGRLRQRIADELTEASVTAAPRVTRV
jgi:fatty-acyl-CoA synthase